MAVSEVQIELVFILFACQLACVGTIRATGSVYPLLAEKVAHPVGFRNKNVLFREDVV